MPIPKPKPSESEADFVRRAHEVLADEFPDAEQRNAVVFKAWRESKGESDSERKAYEKFRDDQFAHIEHVPVFKEHEYPRVLRNPDGKPQLDDDGNPVFAVEKYDFEALRSICDNMNHRIADTGDFAPITDKHTPRKGSDESKPRVLGFSGPFRLGMVGNKDPKWAIFAQEHWFRDKSHLAREMPRRSAEVYLGRPMEERILDPITALGADTPALDMGIHYSEHDGELVARYSGPPLLAKYSAGVAFPGASCVAPPKEVTIRKKSQYSEGDPTKAAAPVTDSEERENPPMPITPEDANLVVQAFMETPPMQFVMKLMQAEQAEQQTLEQPAPDAGAAVAPPGAPPAGGPPPKEQLSEEETPLTEGIDDQAKGPNGMKSPPVPDDDTDDPTKANYALREQLRADKARYSQLESRLAAAETELANERNNRRVAHRESVIRGMRLQGYPIDEEAERQKCSLAKMPSDEEFERHMDTIATYSTASHYPIGMSLYTPDLPPALDRRPGTSSEPKFVETDEFREEVAKACYAEQCKPGYVEDKALYSRVRSELIAKRAAAESQKVSTKVG